MDLEGKPGVAESIAAALDWWREAGVDGDWHDEPKSWLTPSPEGIPAPELPPIAAKVAAPPPPPLIVEPLDAPGDLTAFREWWLTEPRLDGGRIVDRIPPRGPVHAEVMLLVTEPEQEDADSLLSGPQGRLLQAMLSAMGIPPELAYFASVLPRHTPHADWNAAIRAGLGEVLSHHVALTAPKRLIVFGSSILPLLGNDPAQSTAFSLQFNRKGLQLPLFAARDLAALLERPRWKAGFWRDWLAWTEGVGDDRGGTETECD
jgi:DNA polymerase